MMIMEGSKMSKTEYDLKAIMYSAYDTPHKLYNISVNLTIQQPRLQPKNAADPYVSSNAPLHGSSREPGHPLFEMCFLVRGASVRGA